MTDPTLLLREAVHNCKRYYKEHKGDEALQAAVENSALRLYERRFASIVLDVCFFSIANARKCRSTHVDANRARRQRLRSIGRTAHVDCAHLLGALWYVLRLEEARTTHSAEYSAQTRVHAQDALDSLRLTHSEDSNVTEMSLR